MMDKDDDNVLGLDSLDFMTDNGEEFFLATENGATYAKTDEILSIIAKLREINPNSGEFSDEVKWLIAEYERELELWKEEQDYDTKFWIKRKKSEFTP